jgi:hypothetical protein
MPLEYSLNAQTSNSGCGDLFLSISYNDDDRSLSILPHVDDDLDGKILLIATNKDIDTPEARAYSL